MSWLEVSASFHESPSDFSPFIEAYRSFGVENTLEENLRLSGCIADVAGSMPIAEALAEKLRELGASSASVQSLVEQDWETSWRQFFKPRRVGERVLVVPSWEQAEAQPGDIVLSLDPGQAFGTGDHPTTRMCLELLQEIPLQNAMVADVGCGSGILAIAALKLGAQVTAYEIDPIAAEVARENAARNGVTLSVHVADGFSPVSDAEFLSVPQDELPLGAYEHSQDSTAYALGYDVLLANIISHTLIRLFGPFREALKPEGSCIVSGIIEENWPKVEACAVSLGFTAESVLHEDGWVAAQLRKGKAP